MSSNRVDPCKFLCLVERGGFDNLFETLQPILRAQVGSKKR